MLLYSARPFFQTAIAGLRARIVHIDLPIAIALAVTFAASAWNAVRGSGPIWFDSLAMLVAALLGARQIQRSAQRAALERADSLRGAAFLEFARKFTGPGPDAPVVEVPLTALAPGDRVEVRSGELVPVDGIVLSGRSSLDNAVLTGEAAPMPVREGDAVNAGATNLGARLVVRVDAAGARTRVGALLAIVQEALSRKPALLRTTDLAGPALRSGAARRWPSSPALAWLHRGPAVALERVVALLVVACPCALGLSVPLAVSIALLRAARAGIFIKNPDALERLRQRRDRAARQDRDAHRGPVDGGALAGRRRGAPVRAGPESESSHAVARAFRTASGPSIRVVRTVEDVVEVPGQGIAGRLDGHDVRVGNRAHVEAGGASVPDDVAAFAETVVADGLSPVFVAVDGRVAGVAGIGDALRPDARPDRRDAARARRARADPLRRPPRRRRARGRQPRPAGLATRSAA